MYLVFEGGGTHGISYVGALKKLEESRGGKLDIKGVAGASIGSLMSILVGLGATAEELEHDTELLTPEVLTGGIGWYRIMYNLYNYWGMYDFSREGRPFIENLIIKYGGRADITLGDIYTEFGREIHLTVFNVTRGRAEIVSHETHPHWKASEATLAAMSFPGYFIPVQIDGELYVDGGITNNMPMYVFEGKEDVIGMRSIGESSFYFQDEADFTPAPPSSVTQYIKCLVASMLESGQQRYEKPEDAARTVFIVLPESIPSLEFDLTLEERMTLRECGEQAMSKWLAKHPSDRRS